MNWRAALAPFALLAVLLVGNALVAQVQGDIQHQLDSPSGETEAEVEGTLPPLRLNNMKLPSDLPLTLPPGTSIDPDDLSKLTLPEGMDIQLPDGFDLSGLDFDLPEDFDLHLPEGSAFDPSTGNLTLPDGGRITLPDGKTWDLPPGTTLNLPPEMVKRLLEEGVPAGTLRHDMDVRLEGLPPGLNVGMDPPKLDGNGTLHLPPGTQLRLPPGVQIPPEALAGLVPFMLPEGTEIVTPPQTDGFPLPQPDSDAPSSSNQTAPGRPVPGVPIATDIDTWPARIAKGQPFTIEGYVREAETGRDVAGAPVVVYMNETKETAGTLVGRGVSDDEGRFRISVTLPDDKPAQQWQLVNHAGAFVAADGTRYADGWGDPPIETFSGTAWTLQVPSRDGLQGQTPIRGTLVDDTGAPVPFGRVELVVDGTTVRQGATTAGGVFETTYTFTSKGAHTIRLRFVGNSYYDPSESEERTIVIEDVALDVPSTQRVERGASVTLAGRVLVSGIATPGKAVEITLPWAPEAVRLVTDSGGRFATTLAVPASADLGRNQVRFTATEYGASKTQDLDVWTRGRLILDAPDRARVEAGVPVSVQLVDLQGNPIGGERVQLALDGPGGITHHRLTTTDVPTERSLRPPQEAEGAYTLTATLLDETRVVAGESQRAVELGVLEVRWEVPPNVVRGRDASVAATLTFGGKPLAGERVELSLFTPETSVTSSVGRATWTIRIPEQAGLGTTAATLGVPAHAFQDTREVRVVAVPQLHVTLPEDFVPGLRLEANLTLRDDLGAPLANHRVDLALRSGTWAGNLTVTTDANGGWAGGFDTQGAPGQEMAVAAYHPEQGHYLETDEAAVVRLASAAVGRPDIHPLVWGAPILLVGAAIGVGAFVRRRRAGTRGMSAAPVAPTATVLHAPGFDLDLGIADGEPLVWGVGDPLTVTVTPTGANAGRRSVRLVAPGMERSVSLDAPQATLITLPHEGDARISAQRTDDAMAAAVHVDLRVVAYTREISREFDLLLERARRVEPTLDKRSTAQEVEWMLGHRLGPGAADALSEMSLVMDIANYSGEDVARDAYLRFIRAVRALDPLMHARGAA